jgi:hypothetical protein
VTAWRRAGFLLLGILMMIGGAAGSAVASGAYSDTTPPIRLDHLFHGVINRRGHATGFHSRPGGIDPPDAKLLRVTAPPDANGVYAGRVEIQGEPKRANSTFFPDALSPPEVLDAIVTAFRGGEHDQDGHFIGNSGRGFMVEGWYRRGRIESAYPLRER